MASNEKDRLGDKLRNVEKAREDQYFAERDRKLVEQLRKTQEGADDASINDAALGHCPKCGSRLQPESLNEVAVDRCPNCHGVWLDEGELQKLGRREGEEGWISRWLRLEFRKSE